MSCYQKMSTNTFYSAGAQEIAVKLKNINIKNLHIATSPHCMGIKGAVWQSHIMLF